MTFSGGTCHSWALSNPPGHTYLILLQLTTTNQVRKKTTNPMRILFVRKNSFCWENCEFIGRALICVEVGHKNELSCRGVVVRTTSDPLTALHTVESLCTVWSVTVQCVVCELCGLCTLWSVN